MKKMRENNLKKLPSFIVPEKIDAVICSAGGVGTTFLINDINRYMLTNHFGDKDGLKHIVFPPLSRNREIKFIYIFGNPIDSVISLFNRKYHRRHSKKLAILGRHKKPIRKDITIEEYAAEGVERFHFKEHFNNWIKLSKFHPTLFLRYEKIWENIETLYDFLQIPREKISSFPEKTERKSSLSSLDKTTRENLIKMYGEYKETLDEFDDCFILNKNRKNYFPAILFNRSFIYTFKRGAGRIIFDISPDLFTKSVKLLNRF